MIPLVRDRRFPSFDPKLMELPRYWLIWEIGIGALDVSVRRLFCLDPALLRRARIGLGMELGTLEAIQFQ